MCTRCRSGNAASLRKWDGNGTSGARDKSTKESAELAGCGRGAGKGKTLPRDWPLILPNARSNNHFGTFGTAASGSAYSSGTPDTRDGGSSTESPSPAI